MRLLIDLGEISARRAGIENPKEGATCGSSDASLIPTRADLRIGQSGGLFFLSRRQHRQCRDRLERGGGGGDDGSGGGGGGGGGGYF